MKAEVSSTYPEKFQSEKITKTVLKKSLKTFSYGSNRVASLNQLWRHIESLSDMVIDIGVIFPIDVSFVGVELVSQTSTVRVGPTSELICISDELDLRLGLGLR